MRLTWTLPLFLLALPASAGDWTKNCASSIVTTQIEPGQTVCYDPTSSNDDSAIIAIGRCENTDWFLFDDKDGDGTVCTVTWEVELCPDSDANLSASAEDNACEIAAGTVALSGDDVESNIAGVFARVKGDGTGSNADDCRILLKCALRAN